MSRKRVILGHADTIDIHIKGLGVVFSVTTDTDGEVIETSVIDHVNETIIDQNTFEVVDLDDPEAERQYWQRLKHTEVPSREEDQ